MDKKIIIGAALIFVIGVLVWVYFESNKPQPGQKLEDLGREHVQIGTDVKYNSNPPTSGPHYEDWIRAGIYDTPKDDRNLVHSLEHGYVIISYNCAFKETSLIPTALAHGVQETSPSATEATSSTTLPDEFKSDDCHSLVDQLISVFDKKGKRKLVITPRPSLDSKIALTAWARVIKMANFDQKTVETFIDAYRDHGPEQTME